MIWLRWCSKLLQLPWVLIDGHSNRLSPQCHQLWANAARCAAWRRPAATAESSAREVEMQLVWPRSRSGQFVCLRPSHGWSWRVHGLSVRLWGWFVNYTLSVHLCVHTLYMCVSGQRHSLISLPSTSCLVDVNFTVCKVARRRPQISIVLAVSVTVVCALCSVGTDVDEEHYVSKYRVTMVSWSTDDEFVITAVNDFSLKVWDSHTGRLLHILQVSGGWWCQDTWWLFYLDRYIWWQSLARNTGRFWGHLCMLFGIICIFVVINIVCLCHRNFFLLICCSNHLSGFDLRTTLCHWLQQKWLNMTFSAKIK